MTSTEIFTTADPVTVAEKVTNVVTIIVTMESSRSVLKKGTFMDSFQSQSLETLVNSVYFQREYLPDRKS